MKIHGPYELQTCNDYLPKKTRKILGFVAVCDYCDTQYVLKANYTALYWKELKKGKK